MSKVLKGNTNGNCTEEMQLCQRAAPQAQVGNLDESTTSDPRAIQWLHGPHPLAKAYRAQQRKTTPSHMADLEKKGQCVAIQSKPNVGTSASSRYVHISTTDDQYSRRIKGKRKEAIRNANSNRRAKKPDKQHHCKNFKPHFGLESINACTSLITDLATFASVDISDDILRKIEGIVALLLNLQSCDSAQHFFSAILLYVRDFYNKSMTSQIMAYVQSIVNELPFSQQSDGLFDPSWLALLRDVQTNWTLVKGNRAFKQFSKLLGVLVTLGLCDASNLKFDIAGFKVFDEEIIKRHMTAFDLADAIFGTVTYFAEGFYLCFSTGSIQPLLVNDFSVLEMDNEFVTMLSWWDLAKNGNLEKFLGVSESEFLYRLNNLITKLTNLLPSLTGIDKKLVADKLLKLKIIKNDHITSKLASGTRKAPFAVELYGNSSQGKTTFGDQLLDALLISANLPIDKEYRASINTADKFISNWTSDKLVAIFDDLANTNSNFVETAPSNYIINFCNNQMYYANKAEVDGKGKCFVEPELVLVTTNRKDLAAGVYSDCPMSIQRRMDLVMTVKCKPEYQRVAKCAKTGNIIYNGVDSAKVRARYTDENGVYAPPPIDDIWLIDIEQAIKPQKERDVAPYQHIEWRGKIMKDVSAVEAIQCAIEYYTAHRLNQTAIIDGMRCRPTAMKRCSHPGCHFLSGYCPELHPQLGLETAATIANIVAKVRGGFVTNVETASERMERAATAALYNKATAFIDKWDWLCVLPESMLEDERVIDFLMWYNADTVKMRITKSVVFIIALLIIFVCLGGPPLLAITGFYIVFITTVNKSYQKRMFVHELKRRNDSLPVIIKGARDKYAKDLFQIAAGVATLYFMAKVYKHYVALKPTQSALEPENEEEVVERDEQPNPWAGLFQRSLPTSDYSKRVSVDQLQKMVENNLVYASLDSGGDLRLMANLLFLKSNLILIPNHYFDEGDTLIATCYKEQSQNVGGNFVTRLCKSSSYHVPGTDLRICYSSTGGSRKNIIKYLPLSRNLRQCPGRMVWRHKKGDILKMLATLEPGIVTNGTRNFEGVLYRNLTHNTFNGMCGGTWISETKDPCIAGFHLGGNAGLPRGCAGTLSQDDVENAIKELEAIDGILLSGDGEKFEPQMLGEVFVTQTPVHPKSPMNYLPEGSQFEYYGSCIGQSTSRSDVRRTPMSNHIETVCGIPNIWGAPKMQPEWFGWQKALENASHPAIPFPHDLLEVSISDYKSDLVALIKRRMWRSIKPLNDHDNLNGIPGCKFIDAINLNTAIGYPLTGNKRKHIIENEPNPDGSLNREFEPLIRDEIKRCEDLYREGKRAYTVAKACKKDEVLPVAKEKCRIFYGNPISLTFLVRKYYLPVLRFLQMNPLKSECAVGINSHGPEWDEFYKHVMHFGKDRIFGGDYGKYDQKLPSQLLLASLRILIDLARECDYTDEDIAIMKAMSGDLVYSLIAVNGDLIGLQSGTHISGNSLTVILNGICGSLNLRAYFYSRYPSDIPFRDAAHMMTYGDDNIGTVSEKYPEFNIKGCSEFLASYGQEYTMPDKESELVPYLKEEDFEFLKRSNVYHEALDCNIGALSEKSIFKSLHCYMRPKKCPLTPLEACSLNIDGALREWFNHGPIVYESRRQQMVEVATLMNITHMCMGLDLSYDDRAREWKRRYIEKELPAELIDYEFQCQSGHEESDLYMKAFSEVEMTILCVNAVFLHQDFGEVDILFVKPIQGVPHYLIVEIKDSYCQNMRRKGRAQLRRQLRALNTIKPMTPILAVLLTPHGYELVDEAGGIGMWHTIRLPFNPTQSSRETDSQLTF
jgi:hypothetical protein